MADKDWSPEDEIDPTQLQREHLELGKEMLARLKKQEAKEAEQQKEYNERMAATVVGADNVYVRPSFEEVSGVLKRTWDELERIMPTAPGEVKAIAFQTLMHAAAPASRFM